MSELAQDIKRPAPASAAKERPSFSVHATPRPDLSDARPLKKRRITSFDTLQTTARVVDIIGLILISLISLSGLAGSLYAIPLGLALPFLALPPVLTWGLWSAGGYRFAFSERVLDHMTRVLLGAAVTLAALFGISSLVGLGGNSAYLAGTCLLSGIFVMAVHAHHVAFIKFFIRRGLMSENVVIVGATPNAEKLIAQNAEDRELNIVAIFDDRLGRAPNHVSNVPVVGTLDDLLAWNKLPKIDRIIVTVTSQAQSRVRLLIDRLRYLPNRVVLLLDLDDFNPEGASLAEVAHHPAAYVSGAPADTRRAFVKRFSDIVFGAGLVLAFAPVIALIALMVRLDSRGPILFKQKRHGFNNEIIRVWKFRTMRPDKRAEDGIITQVTSDDDRITRIGRFLRMTSLDELPQLFNILIGEMSLVGPRPHAVGMTTESTEVHELVSDYAHRHRVKPGLTGWAQINGSRGPVHTAEEVRERVRLDMEYVNRSSFWFDIYVMLMTAPCLLGDRTRDR